MQRLTVGSLFAGIGGLELGLERTGHFETKWQVEIDDYATKILAKHWPAARRWDDITTFPPDTDGNSKPNMSQHAKTPSVPSADEWRVDLICGGFPCQDISYAGAGAGLNGSRSGLFYEAARVIRTLGPRYVLLENVAALLTRGMGDVLGTLASFGYRCEWHCVPAASVGAPHIRDRVFIIGHAKNERRRSRWTGGAVTSGEVRQAAREDAADTRTTGLQVGQGPPRQRAYSAATGSSWWSTEPNLGRVADGVPARVDRLRCLGNAVVPQVAEWLGHYIWGVHHGR